MYLLGAGVKMRLMLRTRIRIFINYRIVDSSKETNRLYAALSERYGDVVFRDKEGISSGEKWPKRIQNALAESEIVLVIIGSQWLESLQQRLDANAYDWVRKEIEFALETNKVIFPVLVQEAPLIDQKDLPNSMRGLLSFQLCSLRDGELWHKDFDALCTSLESSVVILQSNTPDRSKNMNWERIIGAAFAVIVVFLLLVFTMLEPNATPQQYNTWRIVLALAGGCAGGTLLPGRFSV